MSESTVRWMVHGYRWCPHYKNVYEWDESQEHGCLWCSEWGADDDHPRLGVLAAVARSATPRVDALADLIRRVGPASSADAVAGSAAPTCTCEDEDTGRGFEGCPVHDALEPVRLKPLETPDADWATSAAPTGDDE